MEPATDSNRLDAARAEALAAGDTSALTEIVKAWKGPLDRYLSRICGSCDGDREDVLQEVFIKVFRHARAYDPRLPFSAWIFRICRNEAFSRMRSRRSEPVPGLPEEVSESVWGTIAPLPDAPLHGEETARDIRRIVESMPEKLRDAFVLRFFEEKEYAEIGDILQENENTVATRIRRAREWFADKARRGGMGPAGRRSE